jgi:nicotinamidase-related amidase
VYDLKRCPLIRREGAEGRRGTVARDDGGISASQQRGTRSLLSGTASSARTCPFGLPKSSGFSVDETGVSDVTWLVPEGFPYTLQLDIGASHLFSCFKVPQSRTSGELDIAATMFVALTNNAPKIETRRALVIVNMQNDTFGVGTDLKMVSTDIVEKAKVIIPAFRKLGDIVWATTEFHTQPPDNAEPKDLSDLSQATHLGLDYYFASSRERAIQRQTAPGAEPQNSNLQAFERDDTDDSIAKYLQRAQAGKAPLMYAAGSRGAQIKDDLQPFVDPNMDLQIIKHHHSAFDSTPLLMSLRMKMVTHIYLAGTMTNISVYSTAADAVRHGFEVTVVEDCLGARSEARHVEAMGKMADFLGVSGADSDEIVAEATGGEAPPDADETLFSGPGLEGIVSQKLSDALRPPPPLFNETRDREASDERNSYTNRSAPFGSPQERMTDKTRSPQGSNEPTEHSTPSVGERSPQASMKGSSRKEKQGAHRECGPGDAIGEGDSEIVLNALSPELTKNAFELVREEAAWQVMYHLTGEVPRRVAVQGEVGENGAVPIYRHPADEAPPLLEFTPAVQKIREELQLLLKQPFNHVLIQLYRGGEDYISEHSDKVSRWGSSNALCLSFLIL